MSDIENVMDGRGLVHWPERLPEYTIAETKDGPNVLRWRSVQSMGFTWCLAVFTWENGPRFHPESDNAEMRAYPCTDQVTCLECIVEYDGGSE